MFSPNNGNMDIAKKQKTIKKSLIVGFAKMFVAFVARNTKNHRSDCTCSVFELFFTFQHMLVMNISLGYM